jgi:hypothetical protein
MPELMIDFITSLDGYGAADRWPGWSGVAQLFVPGGGAPLWREVEEVPDRFERAEVAGILTRIGGRVEEFGSPEVVDRVAVAMEDSSVW